MRIARVIGVGVALGVTALLALVAALPRIADSEAVRAAVRDAASTALGRELEFAALDLELFPPSLVAGRVSFGSDRGTAGRSEIDRVVFRIALLPLLTRVVLIDSAIVEGATLRLSRNAAGIRLPARTRGTPAASVRTRPARHGSHGATFDLAVRRLELRRSAFVLDDRTTSPPVRWDVRDIEGRLAGEARDAPFRLAFSGRLVSGGRLDVEGEATLGGDIDVRLALESVAIAAMAPYFASEATPEGVLSGTITASGSMRDPRLLVDLTLRGARLQLGKIGLYGTVEVDATIEGGLSGAHGPVEIDATGAELTYRDLFVVNKPPGIPGGVVGHIRTNALGSLEIDSWKFAMKDFRAATLRQE